MEPNYRSHGPAHRIPLRLTWIVLLLLLAACAGDEQIFKTPPVPTGLAVLDHGLSPPDPGPADAAVAWALVREAETVTLRLARVAGDDLLIEGFDPSTLPFDSLSLLRVGDPDEFAVERWEAPLPLRAENEALLYWFEARAPQQGLVLAPERGALEPVVIPAEPIRIDFPWPAWPPLPAEWDCGADLTRVFDGAEDEATLGGGAPFNVIHEAVWRRSRNATIQSNFAGVTRGIGVEVGDEAYWFPLAVMLWTEVSNQSIGGLRTAATYCPLTDTALHFDTGMDPLALPKNDDYAPAGLFNSNLSVGIEGRRAGESTAFNQMLGFGITGPESGECLAPLPSILVEFSVWRNLHPESWVLHGDDDGGIFDYANRENPYEQYWRDDDERRAPIAREDDRFPGKQRVFGILAPGDPVVVPLQQSRFVHHTEASGIPIVVLRSAKTAIALVRRHPLSGEAFTLRPVAATWRGFPLYEDDTAEPSLWSFDGVAVRGPAKGTRLAWMPSMSAFWFAWNAIYPESRLEEPEG